MGGYGSGRQGGRVTIQGTASYVLNASSLRGLRPGIRGYGNKKWGDGFVANLTFSVPLHVLGGVSGQERRWRVWKGPNWAHFEEGWAIPPPVRHRPPGTGPNISHAAHS